jgi:4-hydroxy-3-methylbut-2-enyl diphosphate reductase
MLERVMPMDVLKITPRGYCYGVVDALTLAKKAARDPALPHPIVVLGQIVHNRHAVDELTRYGIVTLDGPDRLALIDEVPAGATLIFTAHGVSPAVREKAAARGLHVLDATCPDVTKTHVLLKQKAEAGYHIVYIGTRGHPEPAGAIGEAPPGSVTLVTSLEEARTVPWPDRRLAILTQTTLSQWDTNDIIAALTARRPDAEVYNEICLATQLRQEAAVKAAQDVDAVVVVGDPRSNNSNRLVEVVQKVAGKPAYRVETAADLDPAWFAGMSRVGVTAGSSTPSQITRAVIAQLEAWQLETSVRA